MSKITAKLILVAVLFVLTFGIAWLIELCWNATIPYLFGLPTLTYWKAFALQWLIGLLFGRFSVDENS